MSDDSSKVKQLTEMVFRSGTFAGLKVPAVTESLIFLVAAVVLDYLFFSQTRFIDVSPHPFWAILLLIIVQYGVNEAIICALLCSVALLAFNIRDQQLNEELFDYYFYFLKNPAIWLFVGCILGLLKSRQFKIMEEMKSKTALMKKREALIAESYESMKEIKEQLETKLVGQLKSAATAYQAVKKIERLSQNEVLLNIETVILDVLSPKKFSVFSLGAYGLECLSSYGWGEKEVFARRFDSSSPLFQEITAQQRFVSLINPEDSAVIGNEGIMAAPLVDPFTKSVFGMVKIEAMEFEEVTYATMETFNVITEWVGRAYANAEMYESAKRKGFIDEETNLYSYELYKWLFQFLERLGRITPLSIQCIKVVLKSSAAKQKAELEKITTAVRIHLPHSIGMYGSKKSKKDLFILLPSDDEGRAKNQATLKGALIEDHGFTEASLKLSDELWHFGE